MSVTSQAPPTFGLMTSLPVQAPPTSGPHYLIPINLVLNRGEEIGKSYNIEFSQVGFISYSLLIIIIY